MLVDEAYNCLPAEDFLGKCAVALTIFKENAQ